MQTVEHFTNHLQEYLESRQRTRAWTAAEADRLNRAIHSLRPHVCGVEITVSGGFNRPPMMATPHSMALFERAREVGLDLGLNLKWTQWGGSSDANLTTAVGTLTMDGLGPTGEGAHQSNEYIVIDRIPARLALLTNLVSSLVHPLEYDSSPTE